MDLKKKCCQRKTYKRGGRKECGKGNIQYGKKKNSKIEEVEGIHRLWICQERGVCPVKVKFRSQAKAQDILSMT